jgi:hypothetical protein
VVVDGGQEQRASADLRHCEQENRDSARACSRSEHAQEVNGNGNLGTPLNPSRRLHHFFWHKGGVSKDPESFIKTSSVTQLQRHP